MHVTDVVAAVLTAAELAPRPFAAFNVATGDYVTVGEIADLCLDVLGLNPEDTVYKFSGGDRGWRGDVPVVRLNTDRIRRLGWSNAMNTREALRASLMAMMEDAQAGKLW